MNNLFTMTFGVHFLEYEWDKIKRSVNISPESIPAFNIDHALWESALKSLCPSAQSNPSGTPILTTSPSPKLVSTPKPDLNILQMPLSTSSKTSSSSTAVVSPQCTDLRICVNGNATRGQIAIIMVNFPPVVQIKDDDIKIIIGPKRLTNLLMLGVRPCESTIKKCQQLLTQANEDDDEEPDVAIQLANMGVFDEHMIEIWRKAVLGAAVQRKVTEEKRWLSNTRVLTICQAILSLRDIRRRAQILR